MKKLNLLLHCGGMKATLKDLEESSAPPIRGAHYPIEHSDLLYTVRDNLRQHGFRIVEEVHGLTKEGNRYFGLLQLESGDGDYTTIVGVRNSHDKSFAAGIVVGSGVFVCDNLAFSGEIKIARKHTRYIMRDLPRFTHRAITKMYGMRANQDRQFEAYKTRELNDDRARALMVEGVKRGVFGCTALPKILNEWENPSHDEFSESNVWRFFNAVTEVAKTWSPGQLVQKTQLLHTLCNAEVGIAA